MLKITILTIAAFLIFYPLKYTQASQTQGTIDPIHKYAWGEKIGWINFSTSGGNVLVTDSSITGYAWSANYGWINLSPSTSGVKNNGYGDLSGYAWSENLGWINFDNVSIDAEGYFQGIAEGEISGQISLNCSNSASCSSSDYKVKTEWRGRSERPSCNNSLDDDQDGRVDYPNDPGCLSQSDTNETDAGSVPAYLLPQPAERPSEGSSAEPEKEETIILPEQAEKEPEELEKAEKPEKEKDKEKKPELKPAESLKEKIIAKIPFLKKKITKEKEKNKEQGEEEESFLAYLKKSLDLIIPKLAKLKFPKTKDLELKETVPKETPLALKGNWKILPGEPLKKFVLGPLPKGVNNLAQKFSRLEETFRQVGIVKVTDIKKLENIPLKLPGLTRAAIEEIFNELKVKRVADVGKINNLPLSSQELQDLEKVFKGIKIAKMPDFQQLKETEVTLPGLMEMMGLSGKEIKPGSLAQLKNLPLAQLTPQLKEKVPSEVIFARTAGELIDFNIDVSVSENGQVSQKISTLAGKDVVLAVKPENKARKVKGYVTYNGKNKTSSLTPLKKLISEFSFSFPAARAEAPSFIEEKLVLLEFEYLDPDNDGIYTALIRTPVVEGEYEIVTVIEYQDPDLGTRALKLTTIIDPEGYIFEKIKGKEARIPGAIVTLFKLDQESKEYLAWPASEYEQENPQITDETGKYSFLVPEGNYYLKVESPGYLAYEGKPFNVKEGKGVHMNIELKTRYWLLNELDWKTAALFIVIMLLIYNFYRDKKREKNN